MPSPKGKTKVSDYGKGWGQELKVDLEVPSGALCQVRRPGVPGLIRAGVLDSLDSLTGIVQTDHIDRVEKGKDPKVTAEELKALSKSKEKLLQALDMTDSIVEYVVLQPSVLRPIERNPDSSPKLDAEGKVIPLSDDDRVPGQIYTDMIALEDKMFIFQFVVGGVTDLESFRSEFAEALGSMES